MAQIKFMKIIIAGGRDFTDYELMKSKCNHYLQNIDSPEIVSGMAKGADTLAIWYAKEFKLPLHGFPANWNLLGKKAGVIRNKEMLDFADLVICFWDGRSRSTKNMIEITKEAGKKIRIVKY